ncbi:MAG TPA: iron ABC transporter permease [Chloroflexota bacterium]|jgi:iron(III) transport system permease protein
MARIVAVGQRVVALPHWRWSPLLLWFYLALVVLLICFPIAMVALGGFNVAAPGEGFRFGLSNWQRAWSDPQIRPALWNTFAIVAARMALGFVIATLLAWLVARTNLPGAGWFEFAFWLAFFLPTLASIQGWTLLLEGRSGLVNQWLQAVPFLPPSPLDVYSFWGIVWVHVMSHTVSTLFILLVEAFRNMDAGLEEAARTSGASELVTLYRITLPLMRPILGLLVILSFVRGMQSFEIERVLGSPVGIQVYATLVVDMLGDEPPRLPEGAALSTLVLAALVPLIFAQRRFIGERQYTTVTGRMRHGKADLRGWRWPAFGLTLGFALLSTAVPFLAMVLGSFMRRWGYFQIAEPWTLRHWETVLSDSTFIASLTSSIVLGVVSGVAGVVVMFLVAYVLVRTSFAGRALLDFVSWLPWAIPGVLLSLGILTMVLDVPALRALHGTLLVLVLAVVLFRFPLGVHLLKSGLLQLGQEMEEAARASGAGWWYTQARITLPVLLPMLVAAGLMTCVTALNDVSGVILLASVQTRTLSLLALDYLVGQRAEKEAAAVVTTIIVLLAVGLTLVARRIGTAGLADTVAGPPEQKPE